MTDLSSYVFYETRNFQQERKAGTYADHVFIADKKITIYLKQTVQKSRSETLTEKIIDKTVISLHQNAKGVKYLKRFSYPKGSVKRKNKVLKDASMAVIDLFVSHEAKIVVEKTLLAWFNYEYSPDVFREAKDELMFPVLRDPAFPKDPAITGVIAMIFDQSSAFRALRENMTWVDFLKDICHSSVIQTKKDIQLIEKFPYLLLLAEMNLGDSLSSLYAKHGDILGKIDSSHSTAEVKLIRFMFKYLPASKRAEAMQVVVDITRDYDDVMSGSMRGGQGNPSLNAIPVNLRSELACTLLNSLKETHEELRTTLDSDYPTDARVGTQLPEAFNSWFYSNLLETQIANDRTTISSLESRVFELFGTHMRNESGITENSPIRFFSKGVFSFAAVSETYVDGETYDLFRNLNKLVTKNHHQSRGSGCDSLSRLGYVDGHNRGNWIRGDIYLLGDIKEIVEQAASVIDYHLVKLGRDLTPENRNLFLSFKDPERKFKNTWRFYDWGVTEQERILALKKGKISKKGDVQMYNELPDEMFYELLTLETGEDLSPVAHRHVIRGLGPYLAMTKR